MIRNENEYNKAVERIMEEEKRLKQYREAYAKEGLTSEQIKRAIDPILSFHFQLKEEIESYERLKRGDLGELANFHGFGTTIIGLRIALGLTQREFARRLGVDETQVSRDEHNEYHGITVERASKILDALNVTLLSKFNEPIPREKPIKDDERDAASA